MEVTYRTPDGNLVVKFDAKEQTDLFQTLAELQEVFDNSNVVIDGEQVPAEDVHFRVRVVDKNHFYEKVYVGKNPKFFGFKQEYGCSKENKGAVYPKKKDPTGSYKNGGWYKWSPDMAKKDEVVQDEKPTSKSKAKSSRNDDEETPF